MGIRIYGNRLLQTLPGLDTRPTPARVRGAVFNILQGQVRGCRWLDLCSGAGTMGAEALCRGAAVAVGIESSRTACRVIRANWSKVAATGQQWQVLQGDARRLVSQRILTDPFDFIYLDPPYESDLYDHLLLQLAPLVTVAGRVIAEHRQTRELPEQIGSLVQTDHRRYGQTHLTFFQLDPEQDSGPDPLEV